ncbi:MAG TPA: magnesium/cobalt transporter CorA, partial [Flavobacterium sp.]|nr:magnesium/cobalt transporter CorA [Flavobacterium sp.]
FCEYTGIHTADPVEMQLFVYQDMYYEEHKKVSLDRVKKEIADGEQAGDVKWLNVHGLHDVKLVQEIGEFLEIQNFIISDILNVSRRTKMDELDDVLFFSIKSVLQEETETAMVEQISFLLKDNLLVSFQEKKSDFFKHIRERIKTHSGIVRKKRADYLLYLLLDAVMENFYITIENYEDVIEKLLAEARSSCESEVLQRIEKERENLNFMKRAIIPLRDALFNLKGIQENGQLDMIEKSNFAFFERLHHKSLEILDQVEYDLKALDSASNVFFSSQSQRMNQIMKTLTIFSVVFMPLTFIAGVYGMNFENMPELKTENGYFVTLGVMFVIVVGMVYYFKRKRWF